MKQFLQVLIFLMTLSSVGRAGILDLEKPGFELNLPEFNKAYDIAVGIEDEAYAADPRTLNGYNNFVDAKARAKGQVKLSNSKAFIDVGAIYSLNISDYSSYYAPEAYVSYQSENFELSIGRKLFNWNLLDSYWQLGLWQTSFRWNYFHPIEQGLVGAFAHLHNQEWSLLGFVSPLYIPEQGAPYSLSNGKINSQSPWFIPPAKYVQLFSGLANIKYNLVMPNTSDIIKQFSAGGALAYQSSAYFVKLSYVYKPRNSIALPIDGYLALHSTGSDAPVFIYPKVVFHHLAGLDFGFKNKKFSAWFSGLSEFPVNQSFDSNLTYQVLSQQTLLSPGFDWEPLENEWSPKLGASYLGQIGGETSEKGSLSSPNSSIFAYPLNYRAAGEARIAQRLLKNENHQLDAKLKWIEEFRDKASLVYLELDYRYQLLNLYVGADFVGSAAEPSNSGFLPRYRDNGFAYAGASLSF
jgi:hypothetical protein